MFLQRTVQRWQQDLQIFSTFDGKLNSFKKPKSSPVAIVVPSWMTCAAFTSVMSDAGGHTP